MKKVYQEPHQLLRQRKRQQRSLKRKKLLKSRGIKIKITSSTDEYPTIEAPNYLSLTENPNESLSFFETIFKNLEDGFRILVLDMKNVKLLTIEVLLYIISIDKIYKDKGSPIGIKIEMPKEYQPIQTIYLSGFLKYFNLKRHKELGINESNVLPIVDWAESKRNSIDGGVICGDAVDFAKKFDSNHAIIKYQMLYNSLVELMQNTENHAYKNSEVLNNWYLFAVKLKEGIAFYFFDNGLGVVKTAKRTLLEKAINEIMFNQDSILKSVLDGEFRSKTGLKNRNKGLPQVNEFLTSDNVSSSFIITNQIIRTTNGKDINFEEINHDFHGSLFVWTMNYEEEEKKEHY